MGMAKKGDKQTKAKRVPENKPLKRNNGRTKRTLYQEARMEEMFMLHLQGYTYRQLGEKFGCSSATICNDLRREEAKRAAELGERREHETARAVATYEDIYRRALVKSEMYDKIVSQAIEPMSPEELLASAKQQSRVTDHALEAALKARERIDKILGIDSPTKVEVGVQALLDALDGKAPGGSPKAP